MTGSAWSVFLIPPQLVAWDGGDAAGWAKQLAGAPPYDEIRRMAADLGVFDEYALFGSLVAPSFLLIGLALLPAVGPNVGWTRLVAVLTILGTPASLLSYAGQDLGAPWRNFWGAESLLLILIGLFAVPAGVIAYQLGQLRGWQAALLGSTILVLVGSTALFGYFPHGSLVGYGIEVALLATHPRPGIVS